MRLFEKRQKIDEVPPELQPYYDGNSDRVGLMRRVFAAIVLIIIIVLLVLFFRWIWHVTHHPKTSTTKPVTSQSQTKTTPTKSNPTANSGSSTPQPSVAVKPTETGTVNSGAASGPSSTTTPNTVPNSSSNTGSTALSNTGPGSTLVIFTITTATGVVAYQYYLRKRTVSDKF